MVEYLYEDVEDGQWQSSFTYVGNAANTAVVDAGRFNSTQEVQTVMPQGAHWGKHAILDIESEGYTQTNEMYVNFYAAFGSGFQAVDGGGKCWGGIVGDYDDGGGRGGTPSDGTNSWTSRMRFRPQDPGGDPAATPIDMEWYIYHADMSGTYGDDFAWNFSAERGTWYNIEAYLNLGTPGENDAVLQTWVDGDLVFEKTDLRFRDAGYGHHQINQFWSSAYYGGSWTAPVDCYTYEDNFFVSDTLPVSNQPPQASISTSTNGLTVSLDASGSSDPDGTIQSYEWNVDGTLLSGQTAQHTFGSGGNYPVSLTVTDDDGSTDMSSTTVSVVEPNDPPQAAFTSSVSEDTATFDASGSSDPDGNIQSYEWTIAGDSHSGVQVEKTFDGPGMYDVTLTVTDGDGATDTASGSVTIENDAPCAAFSATTDGLTATFDGSGSSDPDGTIQSYEWNIAGQGRTGSSVQHTFASGGVYSVSLTVTDDDGAEATATKDVEVSSPPEEETNGEEMDGDGQTAAKLLVFSTLAGIGGLAARKFLR